MIAIPCTARNGHCASTVGMIVGGELVLHVKHHSEKHIVRISLADLARLLAKPAVPI